MRLRFRLWCPAIAVTLVLAGCAGANGDGGSASPGEADPDATLVFFDASGNETLDPAHAQNNSSLSQEVLLAVYDRLIHLSDDGDPIPGLAEEWSYNDDLTQFTMKLREGATFHDGTPVDSAAVIANFDRSNRLIEANLEVAASVKNTFDLIESYSAPDERTVVVDLKQANGGMEFWFALNGGMMISPSSLSGTTFGTELEPVGAGPYRVASFESNVVSKLERFEEYWGGTEDRPARLEHHYVPDGQARLNAVRSGEANLALIDANRIPEARDAGLEVQINPQLSVWNIYTNLSGPVIGNVKVRQAIMHAIDRESIAEALTFGSGTPTQQLFPSDYPVFIEEFEEAYPYDPDRARQLLDEAGFPDGVDVHFILLNNTEYRQIAEALQQMLGEVGIRLNFEIVDISQATVFRGSNPRGDVMMARWGGRADPLQTFQEVTASSGTYTPGGVADPRIDELVEEASKLVPSDPKRLETLREINRVVIETAATFPIMIRPNVYAYRPGCIDNLTSYLPAGDDRLNDVTVSTGCS